MATANRFPGQYTLKQLTLINFRGNAIDIKAALISVDIQLDIFNSTMHGTLKIQDKSDFQQNFPLIGEEKLIIEFATDKAAGYISLEFYIYRKANVSPNGDRAFIYEMPFSSTEFLRNQETLIRTSFHKRTITDIVATTLKKITAKKLTIDDTLGTISFIPPSIHPFEVINYCLPRAISKAFPNGAGYIFYEDLNGFNFRTIESLHKGNALKYTFDNKNVVNSDFNKELYTVTNYNIIQQFNVLDNMSKGMYGTRTYDINPYTREYGIIDYNYFSDDYKKTEHIDSNNTNHSVHTSLFQFKNAYKGHQRCYPTYGFQNKSKNIGVRYSQLNQITNGLKLIIEVAGNTEINVGKIIQLDYPNNSIAKDQSLDLYMRGKYLVTAVRHILTGSELTTVMELSKDDYYDNHENNNRVGML